MKDDAPTLTVAEAAENLSTALACHKSVALRLDNARSDENEALKALNAAQRAFDASVSALRESSAPWSSDWHRAKHPGVPV